MNAETKTPISAEAFHERLHANHMYGLWELASQMTAHPEPKMQAYLWKAGLIDSIVEQSGEAVPVGEERRAMQLFNPGLDGRWATTNSLVAAIQMLLPGETAPAHRHAPTAIRFIMEGEGAYTAVDGERIYMKPGDLVLTPSWTWHDHGNETDERVVWLDGLDIPLIQSLEAMFFQMYEARQVPLTKPHNDSEKVHGHASLAPTWVREKPQASPLLIYTWENAHAALLAMQDHDGDPHEGIRLEYTHPRTGGSALPTMACYIQMIRAGEKLQAKRETGSAVYYVERGQGETIIDGVRFTWGKGDVLVMPPWALREHHNTSASEDAILFSISDTPVLEKLGLNRSVPYEENGGHQAIERDFMPEAV